MVRLPFFMMIRVEPFSSTSMCFSHFLKDIKQRNIEMDSVILLLIEAMNMLIPLCFNHSLSFPKGATISHSRLQSNQDTNLNLKLIEVSVSLSYNCGNVYRFTYDMIYDDTTRYGTFSYTTYFENNFPFLFLVEYPTVKDHEY